MNQVTVGSDLSGMLGALTGPVVVCDSQGNALGFFSPVKGPIAASDLQLEPPLSIEETEVLRQKHRTGKPLNEILGRLGY